jgi:hypothetical protein
MGDLKEYQTPADGRLTIETKLKRNGCYQELFGIPLTRYRDPRNRKEIELFASGKKIRELSQPTIETAFG